MCTNRRRIPCRAGKLRSLKASSLTSDFLLVTLAQGEYVSSPEPGGWWYVAVCAPSTAS